MIPTVTYDQVRIEQQNRLAHLELRRHVHEARAQRSEKAGLERVRQHAAHGRRAAVAVGAVLVALLALFIF
jgi:hypothetical protein